MQKVNIEQLSFSLHYLEKSFEVSSSAGGEVKIQGTEQHLLRLA